jgi:hypothetical protein
MVEREAERERAEQPRRVVVRRERLHRRRPREAPAIRAIMPLAACAFGS